MAGQEFYRIFYKEEPQGSCSQPPCFLGPRAEGSPTDLWVVYRKHLNVCIRGVFILTTECASLTVTLVVTLRKFVSLIFSILYKTVKKP